MTHPRRPKIIIGNWKMHKVIAEARSFVSGLALAHCSCQVGLAVPYTLISAAAEAARGTSIIIGAQNVSDHVQGPFTGEISSRMLKDAGATFVIVGHSERRQLFHEDDALVNRKIKCVINDGLRPLMCIGETLEQYEEGKSHDVLHVQLMRGLHGLSPSQVEHSIIAYEPVWAVGTDRTPSPKAVEEAHAYCRKVIASEWGKDTAEHIIIQYGGSVKPENAGAFLDLEDVDGLLVGGASLTLESFSKILHTQDIAS